MAIDLTSSAFHEGETIPRVFTGDGRDVSPPLRWGEPPAGTASFAMVPGFPNPIANWLEGAGFRPGTAVQPNGRERPLQDGHKKRFRNDPDFVK